jgi:sec-independent protein translocase protein TatC
MLRIGVWLGAPAEFWETSGYVSFVLKLLVAFGLTFQMPIILLILGNMGIISSRVLRDKRRHVAVGLMVLAMFMTPSDPFTMIMMGAPLIGLYEICIWMIWLRERRHRKQN